MRLNRPHDPRHRALTGSAPNGRAPGTAAGFTDASAESAPATSVPRWTHPVTPLPRRRIVAARAAVVLAVIVLTPAATAHADPLLAQQVPEVLAQEVLAQAESVDAVLSNIRNWLVGILAALATVFLTLGGVRYVYGSGDPGEVEKAKQAFKAAGLGYGIAALAPLVVTVLQSIVGL